MNPRGEENGSAKLTRWDVLAIRVLIADCVPVTRIARAFGITRRTVRSIDQRLIWKWL